MNTFSARKLAITYVGVFLGAGFVSGQELWQFFACFGPAGFAGFLFSSAIFFTITSCWIWSGPQTISVSVTF